MVRAGFKKWVEAGFPRERRRPAADASTSNRGRDEWVRVPHDEGGRRSSPRSLKNIAETYTGEEGQKRLQAQHYDQATVEAMHGAGTQVHEVPRRHAAARRHPHLRHLPLGQHDGAARRARSARSARDQALGARGFDNYSWHTDLPPGHPMVTGQQTVEFDLHAVEHCKTVVVWGMNWITTKMPDAHWLDRGAPEGHAGRRDRLRVLADGDQGRRGDRRPARHRRRRSRSGLRATSSAREALRRASTSSSGPTCRCSSAWTRSSTCARRTCSAASRPTLTNETTRARPRTRRSRRRSRSATC